MAPKSNNRQVEWFVLVYPSKANQPRHPDYFTAFRIIDVSGFLAKQWQERGEADIFVHNAVTLRFCLTPWYGVIYEQRVHLSQTGNTLVLSEGPRVLHTFLDDFAEELIRFLDLKDPVPPPVPPTNPVFG